jgi:hypothetical protein
MTATAPELPPLAEFLRWLAEMPQSFSATPEGFSGGPPTVSVPAVVADLIDTMHNEPPDSEFLRPFRSGDHSKKERNRLRWVLAACHLLWHPALRSLPLPLDRLRLLLVDDLAGLAAVVSADELRHDEERREELVRRTLHILDLSLPGESQAEAEDRLAQVNCVERQRLVREAAEKERRARDIREQLARQAAQEAAARYSPE